MRKTPEGHDTALVKKRTPKVLDCPSLYFLHKLGQFMSLRGFCIDFSRGWDYNKSVLGREKSGRYWEDTGEKGELLWFII